MELITTNEAACRDCYRCVRECPVKAIKIVLEQKEKVYSRVLDDLCVYDGRCVLACPQNAKQPVSDLDKVKSELERGTAMAASIAPSFAAALPLENPGVLPGLLRQMGFKLVQETAVGAELVAREQYRESFNGPVLSSSCPAVVNIVEKHYPEVIPRLSTLVSPMIAHGRFIKHRVRDIPVVFIGPCIAKKGESVDPRVKGAVDYVLGFDELWSWMQEANINLSEINPARFDPPFPGRARLFPVEGGMLAAASLNSDIASGETAALTGLENCLEYIKSLALGRQENLPAVTELMACNGGCIQGPRCAGGEDLLFKKQRLLQYFNSSAGEQEDSMDIELPPHLLYREYTCRKQEKAGPGEEDIQEILAQTGKYRPEDELNCGACGYNSCREKAIAVYRGIAEVEMCIPYMRKRAESMSNLVLNSMPNGAIIADHKLNIIEMNPRAEVMFNCRAREMAGKSLNQLFEPVNFVKALENKQMVNVLAHYPRYGMYTREIIFPLEQEQVVVGLLVDITQEQRSREQFDQMKIQTMERAQEVIDKQMKVAQEIAGLLGETTAETKVLLSRLVDIMNDNSGSGERGPEE